MTLTVQLSTSLILSDMTYHIILQGAAQTFRLVLVSTTAYSAPY